MTDRTNLDVAAEAMFRAIDVTRTQGPTEYTKVVLDAIHPALADLTPDDVAVIFRIIREGGYGFTESKLEVLAR